LGEKELQAIADSVNKILKNWCDELKRLIGFYQSSSSNVTPAESLYLSGGGALLGGLRDVFQKELNLEVHYHNPFRKIHIDNHSFQKEYLDEIGSQMVVPFGLALRAI
jgi:type IV pilus assembly protein PilM